MGTKQQVLKPLSRRPKWSQDKNFSIKNFFVRRYFPMKGATQVKKFLRWNDYIFQWNITPFVPTTQPLHIAIWNKPNFYCVSTFCHFDAHSTVILGAFFDDYFAVSFDFHGFILPSHSSENTTLESSREMISLSIWKPTLRKRKWPSQWGNLSCEGQNGNCRFVLWEEDFHQGNFFTRRGLK